MTDRHNPARGLDSVAERLWLPFRTKDFTKRALAGGASQAGRRALWLLITAWDATAGGPFPNGVIATTGAVKAIDSIEQLVMGPVFDPLLRALGVNDIKFRASLCASALIGLGMMRYSVKSEPICSAPVDTIVDALAPTLQRYLVGTIRPA